MVGSAYYVESERNTYLLVVIRLNEYYIETLRMFFFFPFFFELLNFLLVELLFLVSL